MAKKIDLSGQTAIVTGGGRGVGRAHALMLAERGASVVVNDIGVEIDGSGSDTSLADEVVREIEKAGGKAVASTDDVGTPQGGASLADLAIKTFGKIDMLVHNAGIVQGAPFADAKIEDVQRVIGIHLMGAWHVGQPAWRDMASRGYGRIVFTGSGAMFGHPMVGPYAAAKHGLIGLAKALHQEAAMSQLDIKVNVVCPIAATRMARDAQKERFGAVMEPAGVSAVVTLLLSPEAPVSGEVFHAGCSHVAKIFVGQTMGWALRKPGVTPEQIRDHLDEAAAIDGFEIPPNANAMTDLIYRVVIGDEKSLGDEILPTEYREKAKTEAGR